MSEAILGVPQFGSSGSMDFINSTNVECTGTTRLTNGSSTTISLSSNHNAVIANIYFDYDNGPFDVFLFPGDSKKVTYITRSTNETIQISLNSTGNTITAYKSSNEGITSIAATCF